MKNENIASIIELIESGNDIYNKAIENIDNTSLNNVLVANGEANRCAQEFAGDNIKDNHHAGQK